ncbi:MAG: hypothetical protein WCA49_11115 [Candidatus Sulfotelmatobacter sp.]
MANPTGTYAVVSNGAQGTMQLTVDVTGNVVNSTLDFGGRASALSGGYDDATGLLRFSVLTPYISRVPLTTYAGYEMTLDPQNKQLAFAGFVTEYVAQLEGGLPIGYTPVEHGWWAIQIVPQ